jgi:hypothetical protein
MSIISRTLPAAPGSYATAAEVRIMSGLSATNDVSDSDLNEFILTATLIFTGHVVIRVDGAIPAIRDTARKVFQLPTGLIADQNCDATVGTDDVIVRFYKVDVDGQILVSATGAVTIQDALLGVVMTANALPTDYSVTVDYAHYARPLELVRAKRAVRYLAAHLVWTRVKAPGRITRADITGIGRSDPDDAGRDTFIFKARSRWLDLYRKEVAGIVGRPVV